MKYIILMEFNIKHISVFSSHLLLEPMKKLKHWKKKLFLEIVKLHFQMHNRVENNFPQVIQNRVLTNLNIKTNVLQSK